MNNYSSLIKVRKRESVKRKHKGKMGKTMDDSYSIIQHRVRSWCLFRCINSIKNQSGVLRANNGRLLANEISRRKLFFDSRFADKTLPDN